MATGMAIMGFGGGAMIGSPLANLLMNHFKTPVSVGVWQTFVILALGYFVYMVAGAFGYRVPPEGWTPRGLDVARHAKGHDHNESCRSERRAQDAAILADLGGPVSQRLGGYWDHRRGIANVAGDVRRRTIP
jgi:hypothetical protein